jgi:hypothetical protein
MHQLICMKLNTIFSIILITTGATGCKKFVDVDLPISQLNTEAAFATDSKANSSMRGIYANFNAALTSTPFTGPLTFQMGLSADELIMTNLSGDQQAYYENNLTPDNGTNTTTFWGRFYATIYQANNAYENLEKSKGLSVIGRDRMMGEARFLRAWSYFFLVNMYDSVPLALTSDYLVNGLLHREPAAKVYDQIKADLVYAKEKAGEAYVVAGGRGRANKWAATALMARVQLYNKNWVEAEKEASAVIGSGYYAMDVLDSSFVASSKEAIMVVANAGANFYTPEAAQLTGSNPNTNYRFTTYLDNSFETGDQRLVKWTKVGGNGFRGPFKYKTFSNTQVGGKKEALPVFRLAEQYLIRAEARAMQNNLSDAITDLDSVRRRTGIPLISVTNPNISKDDLLALIMKERFTEFFAEFGHRWFDIKRTGQADAIFGVRKARWRKEAAFFPIPAYDRKNNPNLGQNPGYEQ